MPTVLRIVETLALAVWLGSIVFFSFLTAPALFRTLAPADAARAVRAIFPRYYLVGALCGGALAAVSLIRGLSWAWFAMAGESLALFGVLTVLSLLARYWLTPAINAARDAGAAGQVQFGRLHRLSVQLNALVLLLLVAYAVWMGVRGW
ncbi:MAG: DUF4149 domain-containing protein [Bryobacteraceae bacterium]|nr:DUF4149 domain-containing protein [Bryobacteraceae bacterium]